MRTDSEPRHGHPGALVAEVTAAAVFQLALAHVLARATRAATRVETDEAVSGGRPLVSAR